MEIRQIQFPDIALRIAIYKTLEAMGM